MGEMRRDLPLARLIQQTRLFVDEQAREQRRPRSSSLAARHDPLYSWALQV
jgi:hypothetical protein